MTTINWRVPLAFLFAPLAPCALASVVSSGIAGQWASVPFGIAAMSFVSLAVSIVFCMPAYFILKRYRQIRLLECLIAGACAALALNVLTHVVAAFIIPDGGGYSAGDSGGATYVDSKLTPHGYYVAAWGLIANMILGVTIALCFWAIAFWKLGQDAPPSLAVLPPQPVLRKSYRDHAGQQPAFEVRYRFLDSDEGGRSGPPRQHVRWDFMYEGDDPSKEGISMVWPEFVDESGEVLPEGEVPLSGTAQMFILDPARHEVHKSRIAVGTRGFFMEGSRKVAECEVRAVLSLAR